MTQTGAKGTKPAIAVLIPEFPQQTHIAWWRVAEQMRRIGERVYLVSTRRPDDRLGVHDRLRSEAAETVYVWPPALAPTLRRLLAHPRATLRGVRYVARLTQSSWTEKLRLVPLLASAAYLVELCEARGIDRVFVHSCANAAHLLAMARAMRGPRFGLRLGGDPGVYGKDHDSKMAAASFVMCAAPAYFDELTQDHAVARDKLEWTWVGTDLSACQPAATWPAAPHPGCLRLVTVGRLNATKGHMDVLDAVSRLVEDGLNLHYTIVGEGPFRRDLEIRVAELGLQDRVSLKGALDHGAVVTVLQNSDVHVLASFGKGEAAPAVVCEAMACGLPAICTIIGATPDMILDGEDGFLIPQRDATLLADRLETMYRAPDRLVGMKQAARTSSSKFDVDGVARKVLGAFDRHP